MSHGWPPPDEEVSKREKGSLPSGKMIVSSSSNSHSLPCSTAGVFAPVPATLGAALPFFFARPFWASGGATAGAAETTRAVRDWRSGSPVC